MKFFFHFFDLFSFNKAIFKKIFTQIVPFVKPKVLKKGQKRTVREPFF